MLSRRNAIALFIIGIFFTLCFLIWRPGMPSFYGITYQANVISKPLTSNQDGPVQINHKLQQYTTKEQDIVEKIATNITISVSKRSKISNSKRMPVGGIDEWLRRRKEGHMDATILRDLLPSTEFLSTPESPCKKYTPEIIALVQSGCKRKGYRQALRETWGKMAQSLKIPVVFFVAQCPSSKDEILKYGDIVNVNFVDSYFNNTIKSLSRLKWFLEFCPKATFLLMADDDTLIYIDYLLEYLRGGIGFSIIGPYYPKSSVIRDKKSKWYQSYWAFPYQFYPPYMGGWAYVANGYSIQELYNASLNIPYISVDDALFTGVAATMVGLNRGPDPRFPITKDSSIACGENSIFASQEFSPKEMLSLWSTKLKRCYPGRS